MSMRERSAPVCVVSQIKSCLRRALSVLRDSGSQVLQQRSWQVSSPVRNLLSSGEARGNEERRAAPGLGRVGFQRRYLPCKISYKARMPGTQCREKILQVEAVMLHFQPDEQCFAGETPDSPAQLTPRSLHENGEDDLQGNNRYWMQLQRGYSANVRQSRNPTIHLRENVNHGFMHCSVLRRSGLSSRIKRLTFTSFVFLSSSRDDHYGRMYIPDLLWRGVVSLLQQLER